MNLEQAKQLLEQAGCTVEPQSGGYFVRPNLGDDLVRANPDIPLVQGELLTEAELIMLAANMLRAYQRLLSIQMT